MARLEVGVGEDDVRRLAAELERDLLQVARRGLHDQLADLGRAGERDLSTSGCAPAPRPRLAVAGDDVDHARREARFLHQLAEPQRRQRRLLGRLEHDRAAGRQRRAELPRRHQQREVPRDDLADHADRLAQRVGEERRPGAGTPRSASSCPRSWSPSPPCSGTGRPPAARRPPRATVNGLPLSSDSSSRARRRAPRSGRRASRCIRPRSDAFILRHAPVSNARRAALTARSMSSASPSATSASSSSVAGFSVSKVLPDAAVDPLAVDQELDAGRRRTRRPAAHLKLRLPCVSLPRSHERGPWE